MTEVSTPDFLARYDRVAAPFTATVDGVTDWGVPTPVPGWQAKDVVGHLTAWLPGLLISGARGATLGPIPDADEDPAGSWHALDAGVRALLADPERAAAPFTNPHIGEMTVAEAIDGYFTPDVFAHRWDLARATGQDDRLDPELAARMIDVPPEVEQAMRGSGQYGPRVEVPADADATDRFIAFIGRDPRWAPPAKD